MTGRRVWLTSARKVTIAVMAAVTATGCGMLGTQPGGGAAHPATPPAMRSSAPSSPPMSPVADYVRAVQLAVQHHLRVWIETDLVKRWEAGPGSFRAGVRRAAFLADRPGVFGIKVADELGYNDGMDSPDNIRRFLSDTAKALHQEAPGKLILVDMVVPQLGCLPGHQPPGSAAAACAARAQLDYPQLALPEIDGYLGMHAIDVLDLSTGLLADSTYQGWGTSADAAQRAAWREVARRGWLGLVRLQARKALAHPGRYPGTRAAAEADLRTFIDIPLACGAHAVDVWTWRQKYQGAIYRLMDPGLRPNVLWAGLEQRRRAHDVLFTHMSPHSVESGLNTDLGVIAQVFTDVFLPAGTG